MQNRQFGLGAAVLLTLCASACSDYDMGGEAISSERQAGFISFGVGSDTQLVEIDSTNYGARDRVSVRGDGTGTQPAIVGLIKWSVPPNTHCLAGDTSITINVISTSNQSFRFYPAMREWVGDQANWFKAGPNQQWQIAGAMGPGDRGAAVREFTPNQSGALTLHLTGAGLALVQSWLDNPATNFGIVVWHETHSDGFSFASFEDPQIFERPHLGITCAD